MHRILTLKKKEQAATIQLANSRHGSRAATAQEKRGGTREYVGVMFRAVTSTLNCCCHIPYLVVH